MRGFPSAALVTASWMLAVGLAGAGAADPPAARPGFWHELTRMRLQGRIAAIASGQVELRVGEENGRRLFDTWATARFLGARVARSRTRSILDGASGRPLELVSFTPRGGRRYVFMETGYTVYKLRPKNGYEAPLEQWEVAERRQFDYPLLEDGRTRAPVFDSYGMLLELARLPLEHPGDEATLWVATSKGPRPYRIRVGETRERARHYEDLASGDRVTVAAREFRLLAVPEGETEEAAGLLNLKGEIEIWAEAETKTLIEISGKVPKFPGRATIHLRGFESRPRRAEQHVLPTAPPARAADPGMPPVPGGSSPAPRRD